MEISSVACGISSIKDDFSDYPKSLISSMNEVCVFFNKIMEKKHKLHLLPLILLQSHLLLC